MIRNLPLVLRHFLLLRSRHLSVRAFGTETLEQSDAIVVESVASLIRLDYSYALRAISVLFRWTAKCWARRCNEIKGYAIPIYFASADTTCK